VSDGAPNLAPRLGEKPSLPTRDIPLVEATPETLAGYGELVDDPEARPIEIVRWPAQSWRLVDPGTGDEGGTTEGVFTFWWEGDVLNGRNAAVDDRYVLGWTCDPQRASDRAATVPRSRILLYHANYHPDGGQLFFPLDPGPFVVPLALPGDDVRPDRFTAFHFEGGRGLYIHPNVWHETIVPLADRMRFFDRQGRVHARVSVQFDVEFGVYLALPMPGLPGTGRVIR
jgi:hypothetical protein